MHWNKNSFQELVDRVIQSLKGRLSPVGVPFYIYVYNPKEETKCIREFQSFAKWLRNQGFRIQVIYMGRILATILRDTPYFSPQGKNLEKQYREKLRKEFSNKLPEKISHCLLEGIPGQFDPIRGEDISTGVFLLRTGALFPFVHVSEILAHLENQTHATVVVPFPGSREGAKLRFLNETESRYYRAVILGG